MQAAPILIMGIFQQIFDDNLVSVILFVIFLIVQLCFFIPTMLSMKKMSKIFSKKDYDIEETDGIVNIKYSKGNGVFDNICRNINLYIRENSDSIDLGEMKDVANRLADIEYEKATAKISYPMYIGLMGTYGGVGWGLLELVFSMGEHSDKMFDTNAIYAFIGGVVVAMLTSLVGLLMTTWANNSSVKQAASLEHDKDEFFSFLQTKIIPQLPSTLAQTLREEFQKSIGALSTTIGALSATVLSLNTDLKSTFEGITREFGENLSRNLSSIQTTVNTLTESARSYATTMQKQDEILGKLNSPAFITALTRITETVDRCESTASILQQADDSATQLINKQREIIEEQETFASQQASSMEHVVELHRQLSEITIDSQNQLNALTSQPNEMFNYIRQTLEQFQRIAQFVETYANQDMTSTNQRVEYIDAQLQNLRTAQNAINGFCQAAQSDLEEHLRQNREQLETAARDFVQSWNTMFTHMAATGQNPLVHLEQISVLIQRVDDIRSSLSESKIDPKLYDELGQIRHTLESIKSSSKSRGSERFVDVPKEPHRKEDLTPKTPWWRIFRKKNN